MEAEALWRKKLEAETNSEATNFIRSWKWKQKIFYYFHIPGCKLLVCSLIKSNPKNGTGSKQEPIPKDSKFWSGHPCLELSRLPVVVASSVVWRLSRTLPMARRKKEKRGRNELLAYLRGLFAATQVCNDF